MQTSSQPDNPFQPLLNQLCTAGGKSVEWRDSPVNTAIKHGFSHYKDFQGFPCLSQEADSQCPAADCTASCLHYVAAMMCLFLALRGSDCGALQWQWKSFKPWAGFAASSFEMQVEYKTLLWKKKLKKKMKKNRKKEKKEGKKKMKWLVQGHLTSVIITDRTDNKNIPVLWDSKL